jgi:thioredoxin 1
MKILNIRILAALLFFQITFIVPASGRQSASGDQLQRPDQSLIETKDQERKYKVTFIELGSVRCIPCQKMQEVMKSIETKYGKEVKIEFYDVWTEAGKPIGVKYSIEAIPTQVFLDETGKEYYRHVGFYPEEELVKILQMKGVKIN